MDRKLRNEREKNTISQLTGLYRILQVKNLANVAKTKQVGLFTRNEVSKLLAHTHRMSTVPCAHAPSINQ